VEVTDSGAGIATKDQRTVLGEFIQFNRNEQQGEFWLWISRRTIDMHQGTIGFTSPGEGMGTTFFFELPIYVSQASLRSGAPSIPNFSNLIANFNFFSPNRLLYQRSSTTRYF